MDNDDTRAADRRKRQDPVGYEPPRVERVLTSEEVEREVLFAGQPTTPLP